MADIDEYACNRLTGWDAIKLKAKIALGGTVMASFFALMAISMIGTVGKEATKFSMDLAAFEGRLNATTLAGQHTVSPVFTLKMRVESPGAQQSWCTNGGEVVVSYSDVALAWGHLPGFSVQGSAPMMELRRRLDAERRDGAAQILVDVKLFYSPNWMPAADISGTSLHSYQFKLTSSTGGGE